MSFVLLAADSISPGGHRLSTLAGVLAPAELAAISVCDTLWCTFAGDEQPWQPQPQTPVVLTGADFTDLHHIDVLAQLAGQITEVLGASDPMQVGRDGVHVPFVAQREKQLDLSLQVVLSAARCSQLGSSAGIVTDIERYQQLIAADPPHLGPLQHPAVPAEHRALHGRKLPSGPFQGWYSVRQMMIHRGEPL